MSFEEGLFKVGLCSPGLAWNSNSLCCLGWTCFMILLPPPLECWDYKHVSLHQVWNVFYKNENGTEHSEKCSFCQCLRKYVTGRIQSIWLYSNTLITICLKRTGQGGYCLRRGILRIFYYKLLRTGQEVLGHQKQGVTHKRENLNK